MSAWVDAPGPGYEPQKRVPRWRCSLLVSAGLRAPACAARYEHVGFGDQFEPEPLLPRALEEFHMPRRETQRN
jgi:hypothetical protein